MRRRGGFHRQADLKPDALERSVNYAIATAAVRHHVAQAKAKKPLVTEGFGAKRRRRPKI